MVSCQLRREIKSAFKTTVRWLACVHNTSIELSAHRAPNAMQRHFECHRRPLPQVARQFTVSPELSQPATHIAQSVGPVRFARRVWSQAAAIVAHGYTERAVVGGNSE